MTALLVVAGWEIVAVSHCGIPARCLRSWCGTCVATIAMLTSNQTSSEDPSGSL